FARERVDDAWKEHSRRKKCFYTACLFKISGTRVELVRSWKQAPAYSFCLMLSLQVLYRDTFIAKSGTDYTDQGVLFERLTAEALEALGWKTHATGWSKDAAASILDKGHRLK